MNALFSAALAWLSGLIRGFFADRRAAAAERNAGRAEAERDGAARISEIAERQTARAADPLDEDDVLRRLDGGTG